MAPRRSVLKFSQPHLLGIAGLSVSDIEVLLARADGFVAQNRRANKKSKALAGQTLINLFFENSTRTQSSFEIAGKRLGADVMSMQVTASSVKKGETLLDTAATLNAMNPDLLAVRHPSSGAVALLAQKLTCAVINAGDGTHEHPSQALLDALTIRQRLGKITGLRVAICGDILHSRVARSNMLLLLRLGNEVRLIGPPTLLPHDILGGREFAKNNHRVRCFAKMEDGLQDCDIVMMLRLQTERMHGRFVPSLREYHHLYGLTHKKLEHAKPTALVMHPGPMNRGIEIESGIADDAERSLIQSQVEMGVAVRMAVLQELAENRRAALAAPKRKVALTARKTKPKTKRKKK